MMIARVELPSGLDPLLQAEPTVAAAASSEALRTNFLRVMPVTMSPRGFYCLQIIQQSREKMIPLSMFLCSDKNAQQHPLRISRTMRPEKKCSTIPGLSNIGPSGVISMSDSDIIAVSRGADSFDNELDKLVMTACDEVHASKLVADSTWQGLC